MQKKRPNSGKSLENQADLRSSGSKKVKTTQEETLKLNLVIDEDDEEFDIKPKRIPSPDNYDSKRGSRAESVASTNGDEALTDGNDDECYFCEEGGEILCCDNCFRSFHLQCVKLKREPEGDWICPYCRDLQENKSGECPKCLANLEEVGEYEKITCARCLRNMHLACAEVPLGLIADNPLNKNFLFEAQDIKGLKKTVIKHSKKADEVVKELLEKNRVDTLYHVCNKCLSQAGIQKIKMCIKKQDNGEIKDFYLSKLKRASDIHTFWLNEAQVIETNRVLLRHFKQSFEEDNEMQEEGQDEEYIDEPESYQIEKILACRKPLNASTKNYAQVYDEIMSLDSLEHPPFDNYKFFIKWEGLEYSYSTWEDQYIIFKSSDKLAKYFEVRKKRRNLKKIAPIDPQAKSITLTEKPGYIEGHLYPYQLEGLSWLLTQYLQKTSAVLSDEMGLGKEIQALCFLRYLTVEFDMEGPFLIVVPQNAINYWLQETQKWCPNLDVIIYGGDTASRRKINDYEFFNLKNKRNSSYLKPKFQVAITSYSYINQDINKLKKVKWEVVIIDDAQKLKGSESRLYRLCADLKPNYKVVLTGAPGDSGADEMVNLARYVIQNKPKLVDEVEEISAILVPKPINSAARKINTTEEDKGNALRRLTVILDKYTLKRTARDVKLEYTEIEERLVKVDLSSAQRNLYRNVLLRNDNLLSIVEGGQTKSNAKYLKRNAESVKYYLTNILKNLTSLSTHPHLYYSRNFDLEAGMIKFQSEVLNVSNKLKLLDSLIIKLLSANHKLIIFTQFPLMLDFVEQLLIFKDIEYERIDGATRSEDKKAGVARFTSGKSKTLIISGEVGDLGMNLGPSEIIILIDSQFNLYKDVQPFCKAYPITQKNKLRVYRIVSQSTVEEKIVGAGLRRVINGEMITNPLEQSKHDKSALEVLIKYSAKSILSDNDNNKHLDISNEKVDEIIKNEAAMSMGPQHIRIFDLNEFHVSGFNVKEFSINPKEKEDGMEIEKFGDVSLERNKSFESGKVDQKPLEKSIFNEDLEDHPDSIIQFPVSSQIHSEKALSETSQKRGNDLVSEEDTEKNLNNHELLEPLTSYYSHLGSIYDEIKNKSLEEIVKLCGLDEFTRLKFLEFVLKFEIISYPMEDLFNSVRQYMEPFIGHFKPFDLSIFKEYLKYFYSALFNGNTTSQVTQYFFFKVKPQVVRKRILSLVLLRNKLNQYKQKLNQFRIKSPRYDSLLKTYNNQDDRWTNADDYFLFLGVTKYGMEEWAQIIKSPEIWSHLDLKKSNEKDLWRIIFRKIEGKDPIPDQEKDCFQFVQEYLKMRTNILMDLLLEEKEDTENTE